MIEKLCKYLYRRNKSFFHAIIVQDLVGEIPITVREPASDFLATAGQKLEKLLLWQSWILQRKAASEPKFAEVYQGMLLQIKIFLMMASKKTPPPMKQVEDKKQSIDHLEGVKDFIKGFKKTTLV